MGKGWTKRALRHHMRWSAGNRDWRHPTNVILWHNEKKSNSFWWAYYHYPMHSNSRDPPAGGERGTNRRAWQITFIDGWVVHSHPANLLWFGWKVRLGQGRPIIQVVAFTLPAAACPCHAWQWLVVVYSAKQKQQCHHQQLTNGSTIMKTFTYPNNLDLF